MRIDVDKRDFQDIVEGLNLLRVKNKSKDTERLYHVLDQQLNPRKAPTTNGWAPLKRIKSSWPSGHILPKSKGHWSFKRDKPAKTPKGPKPIPKPATVDDILADLNK